MDMSSLPFLFLTVDSPFAARNEFYFLKVFEFSNPSARGMEIPDPVRLEREKGLLLTGERAKLDRGILLGEPDSPMREQVGTVSP